MIIKKVTLLDAPAPTFVGTRITVSVEEGSMAYGLARGEMAEGSEKVTVDWGDGTVESVAGIGEMVHAYASPGEYVIRLSDDLASLAASSASIGSPFEAVYPSRVTGLFSNATKLTALLPHAFRNCVRLASLDLSGSAIASFGNYAFMANAALGSLDKLPRGLATLKPYVFSKCTGLRRLANLPTSLTELSAGAFHACTSLAGRYDLPDIKEIRGTGNAVSFYGCTGGIEEFHFSRANEASVRASYGYQSDPTLGTGTAACVFDL